MIHAKQLHLAPEELNEGLVQRARLDGSELETLVDGLQDPGAELSGRAL